MKTLSRTLGIALLSAAFGQAAAQEFPTRPVHWILSQPAGSSPDISARLLADGLSKTWNQQVVVDNRPGGQNVIGAQAAAKSPGDGYNYYFATTAALVSNPLTFKALPYNPERDFVPVAMIGKSPMVIAVNNAVPANSIAELVALDKKDPGKLAAANEGTKTFGGMMSQLLNVATGMRLLQVPYNGVAPALQDTVAGRTQVVLVSSAAMSPFIKRGDLRPIAVTAGRRVTGLEHVPTMAESYPGFEYVGWFALVAPAGTPESIVRKVNADVNAVLGRADIQKRLLELGAINEGPGTPEQLAQFLKDERTRWAKLVKDINLQP
ncbi:MAG TPA: tripartite tricarboxylate transporter substrate binding protein, partial [Burkholderiales bacterium]|nr:tripartite tricarboxylate transporter substrate binding protein [Burkholderiales bacterium]